MHGFGLFWFLWIPKELWFWETRIVAISKGRIDISSDSNTASMMYLMTSPIGLEMLLSCRQTATYASANMIAAFIIF
jgi:hypothetical protein